MPDPAPDNPATPSAALAVEWTRAQPVVAAFVRSVVPDYHAAQDVLQQTAIVVFEKFAEYDRSRPFAAWAIGIARYEAMHARRSHARDRHSFDSAELDRIADAFVEISDELSPMAEALEHCLQQVAGHSRAALELKYRDNLPTRQIADRLSMRENAVFTMLSRTRSTLRRCIEERIAGEGPR